MLNVLNDIDGQATDWWFMYKLPKGVGSKNKQTLGNEYLIYDPEQKKPLQLSANKLGHSASGAYYHTLKQIFDNPTVQMGWIFYNDEYPDDMSPYDPQLSDPNQAAKVEDQLLTAWSQGKSDWPPNVKPKIGSDKSRKSDRGMPTDHGTNGHNKGILAFDLATDSAFWLSHSTPKIPVLHQPVENNFYYPESTWKYAQTFICISLADISTACEIAKVLAAQHEPQVFGCHLPEQVTKDSNYAPLWQLAQGSVPPSYGDNYTKQHGQKPPATLEFKSRQGKSFQLIAKSGAWDSDFWIDLVGPSLTNVNGSKGVDLRVETWRRLTPSAYLPYADLDHDNQPEPIDFGSHDFTTTYKNHQYHHEFFEANGKQVVDEITNIDLSLLTDSEGKALTGLIWPYTKDHAKWAISEQDDERGVKTVELKDGTTLADQPGSVSDWVVVADLNRMSSQEKRGGGAICFHEPLLWHGLNQIERISGKIT